MEEFRGKCKSCNGIGVVYDGMGVWRCRLCNKDFTSEEIENYLYDEAIRERDALKAENERLKKDLEEAVKHINALMELAADLEYDGKSGIACRQTEYKNAEQFLSRFPVENKKEDGNG